MPKQTAIQYNYTYIWQKIVWYGCLCFAIFLCFFYLFIYKTALFQEAEQQQLDVATCWRRTNISCPSLRRCRWFTPTWSGRHAGWPASMASTSSLDPCASAATTSAPSQSSSSIAKTQKKLFLLWWIKSKQRTVCSIYEYTACVEAKVFVSQKIYTCLLGIETMPYELLIM